jgi:hypothetical protein
VSPSFLSRAPPSFLSRAPSSFLSRVPPSATAASLLKPPYGGYRNNETGTSIKL